MYLLKIQMIKTMNKIKFKQKKKFHVKSSIFRL
jgi:hypothetical protein